MTKTCDSELRFDADVHTIVEKFQQQLAQKNHLREKQATLWRMVRNLRLELAKGFHDGTVRMGTNTVGMLLLLTEKQL